LKTSLKQNSKLKQRKVGGWIPRRLQAHKEKNTKAHVPINREQKGDNPEAFLTIKPKQAFI
jgi:hypothetical protein